MAPDSQSPTTVMAVDQADLGTPCLSFLKDLWVFAVDLFILKFMTMLWKHALLLVLLVSILINIKVGPLCYPAVPPLILGLFFNVRDLMERPLLDLFLNLNETYISPHTEAKFSHPYLNLVMNFRVCKTFSFLPLFLNREKRKKGIFMNGA